MRLEFRTRGLTLTAEQRTFAERRLHFSLSRFADRLVRVTVQLEDVNGPRGGEDKRVCVSARLHPHGEVRVEERDQELEPAVARAAGRVGASVARELERERVRRAPPSSSAA